MAHSVTGREFERIVQGFFKKEEGLDLTLPLELQVGLGDRKRNHRFDLGSHSARVLVECKCHSWTLGGNSPSAKLSIWNEAMLFFLGAPKEFRKIFVVKRSLRGELSLALHYLEKYDHLVPEKVEIWEIEPRSREGRKVYPNAAL